MQSISSGGVAAALQELTGPNSKEQVKEYVKASDHLQFTWLADGMVQVNVTHSNLRQFVQELRLDLHTTIYDVKRKLYTHNGSSIACMELQLKDSDGSLLCRMLDDDRMLGFYGVRNGQTIHVLDTDPFSLSRDGGLDDVSRIEKYTMADKDYDERENTYRAFKKKMQAGNPAWKPVHGTKPSAEYLAEECTANVTMGARCSIPPGDRRGEVVFIGLVPELSEGYWVGLRLDEPVGKNDGTVKGVWYFEADDKYGSFVRPDIVTCGIFPSLFDEECGEL
jgi:tubulin-folding cofactor B